MVFTNKHFRKEIMKYLDEHWREKLSAEEVALVHGYSTQYFNVKFKESFGIPFLRYFTKLKLHRVAKQIAENGNLTNMASEAGYANPQSFSKAFRKEFGMSPMQFLESDAEIPDMPVCCKINGSPVQVEYMRTEEFIIEGQVITPVNGNDTDLKKEVGYYFDHINPEAILENDEVKYELWWHDECCNTRYVIGNKIDEKMNCTEDMVCAANAIHTTDMAHVSDTTRITIPSDYYAVISANLNRGGYKPTISDTVKKLTDFIFGEWYLTNKKATKRMGIIFEKYEKNRISIYVPMYKRYNNSYRMKSRFKGAKAWNQYIEENLFLGVTAKQVAEHFGYCEGHFSDTYEMYFGVRPGLYIKKRRLYLAAKELREGETDMERIIKKYGYYYMSAFEKNFEEIFSCKPLEYNGEEVLAEDLQQYYSIYKHTILVSLVQLEDIYMIGENVTERTRYEKESGDLIETISWMLEHEAFSDAEWKLGENKVVVWQTEKKNNTTEQNCLVGPEAYPKVAQKESGYGVRIDGGYYVMIESLNLTDRDELASTYRMLYRCSFDGWIRENQERVDLNRLTFVRYIHGKLYFMIPVFA